MSPPFFLARRYLYIVFFFFWMNRSTSTFATYLAVLNLLGWAKKTHQSTFWLFDDDKTMVQTRQRRSTLAVERAKAQFARERLSEAVRAERLAITKKIAQEIVCTQDSLVGGRYGCRMSIIRKYCNIYSWLSKHKIDWHIKQIRKRMISNATSNMISNVATLSNSTYDVNDSDLDVNSTITNIEVNEAMVSSK